MRDDNSLRRRGAAVALLAAVAAGLAPAGPEPVRPSPPDRAPRKLQPLAGKAVGLLVRANGALLTEEGRGGPEDALCFSSGGGSYRWVYVPAADKPLIGGLRLRVGPKGDAVKRFDRLDVARPATVKRWDVTGPVTLVEVEINGGLGSPADESFVATRVKVVEGTPEYPLRAAAAVTAARGRYPKHARDLQKDAERALAEAKKDLPPAALKGGRRETTETLYATWLPERNRLQIRLETRLQDRYPLPAGGAASRPRERLIGVRFGMTYDVSRMGTAEEHRPITPQAFRKEVSAVPAGGDGRKAGDS